MIYLISTLCKAFPSLKYFKPVFIHKNLLLICLPVIQFAATIWKICYAIKLLIYTKVRVRK